jgi:hypothetical protein
VTYVQFEISADKIVDVLEVLKPWVRAQSIKLMEGRVVPPLPSDTDDFEKKAFAITSRIRPRAHQPTRLMALQHIFADGDSWIDADADANPALRNATGAVSKALRRFAPYAESPLDIICTRHREVFRTGAQKGQYKGTRYSLTRLGQRVRAILMAEGVL